MHIWIVGPKVTTLEQLENCAQKGMPAKIAEGYVKLQSRFTIRQFQLAVEHRQSWTLPLNGEPAKRFDVLRDQFGPIQMDIIE